MPRRPTLLLLALSALLIVACSTTSPAERSRASWERRHPELSALDDLSRLASIEHQQLHASSVRSIAPPASIAPYVQRNPDADESMVNLTLEEVFVRFADRAVLPPPINAPAVDPAPNPEAIRHYIRGRERAQAGQHLAAIVDLEKARELDSTSIEVLRELARSYGLEGNSQKVRELYTELLTRDPNDGEALFTLAMTAASQGEFEQAVALLARHYVTGLFFNHDPADDLLAYHTLHVSLRTLGYDRAALDSARALASNTFPMDGPSIYTTFVAAVARQRGELLRWIGDLYCRSEAFDEALRAYAQSTGFPQRDPAGLQTRVLWCHLSRGASYAAGRELLAVLRTAAPHVNDGHVQLCAFVAEHTHQAGVVSEALRDLYEDQPDVSGLAQAVALFLPEDQAATLLSDYAARHPDDLAATGRALSALAETDASAAVARAAELCSVSPHYAAQYADHLAVVLPAPVFEIPEFTEPVQPRQAELAARILARGSALGRAWQVCAQARATWPDDHGLELLAIALAGTLDEPALVQQLINESAHLGNAHALMVKARACRSADMPEAAVTLSESAVHRARLEQHLLVESLLESARAHATSAAQASPDQQLPLLNQAIVRAEEALRLAPDRDEPYEVLLALYPNQPTMPEEINRARPLIDRLRAERPGSRLFAKLIVRETLQQGAAESMLPRAVSLAQSDPTDVEALALAVAVYEQLDQVAQAESWLVECATQRPADARVSEQLVNLMLRHDRAAEAASLLQARSGDPFVEILLELVARVTGDDQEELALAESRLSRRPEGTRRALQLAAVYRRAGRTDEALEQLRWFAGRSAPSSRRQTLTAIEIARQLVGADAPRDEFIVDLVSELPAEAGTMPLSTWMEGVLALVRLGDRGDRLDSMLHAAARNAYGADDLTIQGVLPWRELAQHLVSQEQSELAADALRARLFSDHLFEPGAVSLLTSMIMIVEATQDIAGTERALDVLLRLDAQGQSPALPGVEGTPNLAESLLAASGIFSLIGNEDGAEVFLQELIRVEPEHVMGQNNLGYARIVAGHGDEQTAIWCEKAAVAAPDDVNILDTIGWLRYRQGHFDEALQLLNASTNGSVEPPAEGYDHLGDTHWRLGNEDEAIAAWQLARDQLADPEREKVLLENFTLIQQQMWGLVVADPEEMYHRAFGVVLVRVQEKLAAAEAGVEVPITPTFDELLSGSSGGSSHGRSQ